MRRLAVSPRLHRAQGPLPGHDRRPGPSDAEAAGGPLRGEEQGRDLLPAEEPEVGADLGAVGFDGAPS